MKKLLSLLLVALMVLSLVGCGSRIEYNEPDDPVVIPSVPNTGTDTTDVADVTSTTNTTGPESDQGVVTVPEVEPVKPDPMEKLEVSKAFIETVRSSGGGGSACVLRDGKLYIVSSVLPLETSDKYGFGTQSRVPWATSFQHQFDARGNIDGYLSLGDVPIATLEPGDQLVSFGATSLALVSYRLYGDSLRMVTDHSRYVLFRGVQLNNSVTIWDPDVETLKITDGASEVTDIHDVNFSRVYTVEWFEGTTYHEERVAADSHFYVRNNDVESVTLEGELNKGSYAVYDTSGLAPGVYYVGVPMGIGGFVRIGGDEVLEGPNDAADSAGQDTNATTAGMITEEELEKIYITTARAMSPWKSTGVMRDGDLYALTNISLYDHEAFNIGYVPNENWEVAVLYTTTDEGLKSFGDVPVMEYRLGSGDEIRNYRSPTESILWLRPTKELSSDESGHLYEILPADYIIYEIEGEMDGDVCKVFHLEDAGVEPGLYLISFLGLFSVLRVV